MLPEKRCKSCDEVKPVGAFGKHPTTKDRLQPLCRQCASAATRAYFQTDKGREVQKRALRRYLASAKGRSAQRRATKKLTDAGYFRYGKGAISILKAGATKRGVDFALTEGALTNWWQQKADACAYCGIDIDEFRKIRDFLNSYAGSDSELRTFKGRFLRSPKHASINWMTIDRVDNGRGYESDNIVKCCWICNSLKGDILTSGEMRQIARSVMARLQAAIERADQHAGKTREAKRSTTAAQSARPDEVMQPARYESSSSSSVSTDTNDSV